MKRLKSAWLVSVLLLCSVTCLFGVAYGEESPRLTGTVVDSSQAMVKLYVRDADGLSEGAACQIGDSIADIVDTRSISVDEAAPRTLFVVDVSGSLSKNDLNKVKKAMISEVDNPIEGELFRVCLISDDIAYLSEAFSNDYTAVHNAIGSIKLDGSGSFTTDALYDIVTTLEQDSYDGYTRIVAMSDGIESTAVGITSSELESELVRAGYPVYAIGTMAGASEESSDLERLFALSRQTGADVCVLEDKSIQDMATILDADKRITVFTAEIPESQQLGALTNARLMLSDGTELTCSLVMPFKNVFQEEEEKTPDVQDTNAGSSTSTLSTDAGSPVFIAVAICAAATSVVFGVMAMKRARGVSQSTAVSLSGFGDSTIAGGITKPVASPDATTVKVEDEMPRPDAITVPVEPDQPAYRITLEDTRNSLRNFSTTFVGEVTIGRAEDRGLRIGDDETVGRNQCTVIVHDGAFFLRDEASTNHTVINGMPQKRDAEVPLAIDSVVVMGRNEYIVKLEQV